MHRFLHRGAPPRPPCGSGGPRQRHRRDGLGLAYTGAAPEEASEAADQARGTRAAQSLQNTR